jgi:anaerobic dimethyl sulfoxide reductase subunit C (anchor subunit)
MGTDIRLALTLFTVLAPAGAIAYISMALVVLRGPERDERMKRLEHYLIAPLAVCMVGLVASATHLGTPSNALYVLLGWGRSPLSNEVVAALVFLLLAGLHWLLSFSVRFPFLLARIWLIITGIVALRFVSMISVVYAIPTIPTWDNPLVPLSLWLLAFSTGPLLGIVSLRLSRVEVSRFYPPVLLGLSAVAYVSALVVSLIQNGELAQIRDSFGFASEVIPWYHWCILAYGLLGAAGLAVSAVALRFARLADMASKHRWRYTTLGIVGLLLMLAGAASIRIAFYAMHITVGL